MAKSKNGGSRAFIRGRIGSDVYSVGKNGSGQRQQVVRSLAVQVSNPRTSQQMFGRMIMSTVMQAVSGLSGIIDHSFDGFATGQPSVSEFIRRNYQLIKADAIANPTSGNAFGLNKYQEKGIRAGAYVVSDGQLVLSSAISVSDEYCIIQLTADTLTAGGLRAAMGVGNDGYLTYIVADQDAGACFLRFKVKDSVADSEALTAQNIFSLLDIEANQNCFATVATNQVKVYFGASMGACTYGVIASKKVNGAWEHNNCVLTGTSNRYSVCDGALPTYPVGSEQFLNGGDL